MARAVRRGPGRAGGWPCDERLRGDPGKASKGEAGRGVRRAGTLKSLRVRLRSVWSLSPWMAEQSTVRARERSSWSHMRLVEQKTMTRAPGPSARMISLRRASFSPRASSMTLTICVTSLLAASWSELPM